MPKNKNWEIVDLGNFIELETGKRERGGGVLDGEVPSLGGEHVDNSGNIVFRDLKYISETFYDALPGGKVKKDDVLIVKDGATTGKTAYVRNLPQDKVAINEHVFILRSKSELLNNEFLFYYMYSRYGQTQIKQSMHGMIGGITREDVTAFTVPIPPLPEQKKIVEILSAVDERIEMVNQKIEKIEKLRKELSAKLLNGEMGRGKDWVEYKLSNVCHINPETVEPERRYGKDTFLYVDIDSVENGTGLINIPKEILGVDAPSRARRVVRYQDVVMSTVRPYLKAFALIPKEYNECVCSTGFAVLRCGEKVLPTFLLHSLFSKTIIDQCNKMMTGGQYPALNSSQVSEIKLLVPPMAEQQKISETLSVMDNRLGNEKLKKDKLENVKKSLMNDLLSGRKRVRLS